MERLTERPRESWDDLAEMERLRGELVRGTDERSYPDAVLGWTAQHARQEHDLAPAAAAELAEIALVEVSGDGSAQIYLERWERLQVVLSGLVADEVARSRREPQYGDGDEALVEVHLRRGAAKFKGMEWARQEDAVSKAFVSLVRQPWWTAGQRRGAGFFVHTGYRSAVSLDRQDRRREAREERVAGLRPRRTNLTWNRPTEDSAVGRVDAVQTIEDRRQAAVAARNRLVVLAAEQYCLYHDFRCPRSADLLRDCDDALASFDPLDAPWQLLDPYLEQYRSATRSRDDFSRTVRRCAHYRTYTLFVGTAADVADPSCRHQEDDGSDHLRWKVAERWGVSPDRTWNSATAPLRQVRLLLARDPHFVPLLVRHKPDVADFLGLTAGTDPTGAQR